MKGKLGVKTKLSYLTDASAMLIAQFYRGFG